MRNLIEVEHLAVRLGDTPVLHDVTLRLGPGVIYGLLGPNGAGKSTTIAALLGLVPAKAGTMRVLGQDPATADTVLRRRIGVLPEQNGLYDWMTAEAYLAFFAALHGTTLHAAEIADRLAEVGLVARPRQTIGTFSRGMRQRLGLARALIGRPDLLILDEPTNGLDPRGRRDIHDLLLRLAADQDVGILLCSHLLDDVERLCNRVGIIVAGRTAAEGPIAELGREGGRAARFRIRLRAEPPAELVPPVVAPVARDGDWHIVDLCPGTSPEDAWRTLLFAGWPVIEIKQEGGGLEDLYLALTDGGRH